MSFQWHPFSAKQLDFIAGSTAKVNIADGPIRSGKTVSCLVRWIEYVKTAPRGDLMMVGKTERTLYRNAIAPLQDMVGRRRCRYVRGAGEVHLSGRVIYAVGANDARAEEKIRGATLAGAYLNEVTLIPENAFKQVIARCSIEGSKIFGDTNPDSPFHWLHTEYLTNTELLKSGFLRRWQFRMEDNLSLSEETKASYRALYTGLWYKRMILGLWVQAEGAIYDMFDEPVHVVDDVPGVPVHTFLVPIDYATANPTAFLKLAVVRDRQTGLDRVYGVDEYYYDSVSAGRQKTDAEYSADLRRFIKGIAPIIYVDPSAASFKAQLRKDRVNGVRDADNSVVDGIRLVSSFLSNRRLFFVRGKTPRVLQEITSYVWDPRAQKKGEDKPLKQNDHCLDALRYGIYTHFKRDGAAAAPVPKHPAW